VNRLQISLAAGACALVAAAIVPGNRIGLGLLVVVVLGAAIVVGAKPAQPSLHSLAYGAIALCLYSMIVIRSAGWVVAIDLVAATAFASLAIAGRHSWAGVTRGSLAFVRNTWPGFVFLLQPFKGRGKGLLKGRGTPAMRGAVIGAYLLLVFGFLFATADRAFLHLATEAVTPSVSVSEFPARVYVFLIILSIIGALIVSGSRVIEEVEDPFGAPNKPTGLGLLEWAVPLTLLNALFLTFVIVQLTVLFGGRQHVLETVGLSYADYARSGFFQLLAVAFLVLAVVAGAVRWARADGRVQLVFLRGLLGLLCVSTLVVLGSAMKRLMLYEDTFGFTRLRISVHATIIGIGVFFIMLIVAGLLWRAAWLPKASAYLVGIGLVVFTLVNPDAQIARQNVTRYERTGSIDLGYLGSLSADAAGSFQGLPEPMRSCLLGSLDDGDLHGGWASWNLARVRARDEVPSRVGSLSCSYVFDGAL
jgi:Domain of unknown function (DUF4173)